MAVQVLFLEPPEKLLEERRRLGLDAHDEMWDGVLHVVPPAGGRHQDLGSQLLALLLPLARERDLRLVYETGFFTPGRNDDWRVPDLMLVPKDAIRDRGVDGDATAVVEIRSPRDESYDKIPHYLRLGVEDVVIVDRDTLAVEVYGGLDEDGTPVLANDTRLRALDVELHRLDDDRLAVTLPDGTVEVIEPTPPSTST